MKEFRSKLNYVWQFLSRTLKEFEVALLGYRVYTAFIDQSGTDDPVPLVLKNTLGADLTWTRYSESNYFAEISKGVFDIDKTFILTGLSQYSNPYTAYGAVYYLQPTKIVFTTFGVTTGGELNGRAFFELRIYNR